MNTNIVVVGLLLVGAVMLVYSGLSFRMPGEPIYFLGWRIARTNNHFIPPAAGVIALAGGIVLWLIKPK